MPNTVNFFKASFVEITFTFAQFIVLENIIEQNNNLVWTLVMEDILILHFAL